jgi:transglutaminase-like putative cysteine protease
MKFPFLTAVGIAMERSHDFLQATDIVDYEDAAIASLAAELGHDANQSTIVARCFDWVRDNVRHSIDHNDRYVTISASDVLRNRTGLCYAKSHLLAALLRANCIPCGFVYQRLTQDESGTSFCLHGLNAVWLTEHGWYRLDPRGNRDGIATSFDPPHEKLAFETSLPGEGIIDGVFPEPLPIVISTLSKYSDLPELCRHLPDWIGPQSHAAPPVPVEATTLPSAFSTDGHR